MFQLDAAERELLRSQSVTSNTPGRGACETGRWAVQRPRTAAIDCCDRVLRPIANRRDMEKQTFNATVQQCRKSDVRCNTQIVAQETNPRLDRTTQASELHPLRPPKTSVPCFTYAVPAPDQCGQGGSKLRARRD